MRLQGRVAIITGAADGIGKATAIKLAEEGADSLLVDINSEGLQETVERVKGLERKAVALVEDVSANGAPQRIIDAAVKEFGGLHILVNNAGISSGGKPFLELVEEDLDRVLAVNLFAPFLLTRAAADYWIRNRKKGRIVNTSSINAEYVQGQSAPYCASKGGVRMLTKGAAMDLGPYGITVNAVGPGHTRTGMTRNTLTMSPEVEQEWVRRTPLGRLGEPEDIANAIAFLASDDASYITGQTIYVEGGRTIHSP